MTIPEVFMSVVLVYWFVRLLLPVMEWHDLEKRERRAK